MLLRKFITWSLFFISKKFNYNFKQNITDKNIILCASFLNTSASKNVEETMIIVEYQ